LEDVHGRAGRKVLMEVDDNIWMIIGDLQGILDQQLRPRQIHFLIIVILILIVLDYLFLDY
jgi:hypothetical protein